MISDIYQQIIVLIQDGSIKVSEHGYDEMAEDDLFSRDIVAGAVDGIVVEEYPHYQKGPCVLVL
jgi:hypothetical protein